MHPKAAQIQGPSLGDPVACLARQSERLLGQAGAGEVVTELGRLRGSDERTGSVHWRCAVELKGQAAQLLRLAHVPSDDPVPEERTDNAAGAVGVALSPGPVD